MLTLVIGVSLISGVALAKGPKITSETIDIGDGDSISFTLKMDELAICERVPCYLWIGKSYKDDDKLSFLRIDHEGAWTLSGPNEHFSKDFKNKWGNIFRCDLHTEEAVAQAEEEKEAEEEEEKEEDEDATPDESWRDEPILSVEERRRRQFAGSVSKQFCEDKGSGTAAGEGNERTLELSGDQVPENDFFVWSNGHFGAYVGSIQIGQPSKTGGIKFNR
jgi:hypothetical protein